MQQRADRIGEYSGKHYGGTDADENTDTDADTFQNADACQNTDTDADSHTGGYSCGYRDSGTDENADTDKGTGFFDRYIFIRQFDGRFVVGRFADTVVSGFIHTAQHLIGGREYVDRCAGCQCPE